MSGLVSDAWTLARTELHTTTRHYREDRRRLLGLVGMVVGFGLFVPLSFIPDAITFGRALAGGTVPLGTAGVVLWGVTGVMGYVGVAGGFNQPRVGTVGPLVRTALTPTAVSTGRLLNLAIQSSLLLLPAGIVLLVGVAIGGTATAAVGVALGLVPVAVAGFVGGRLLGDALRYVNERLAVSLWLKAVAMLGLTAVVFFAFQSLFGGSTTSGVGQSIAGTLVPATPMHSYAGVVLALFGGQPTVFGLIVLGLVVLTVPVGLWLSIRLEAHILTHDIGSDTAATDVNTSQGTPGLLDHAPSTRVAWRYLLRTRRDPRMLTHLTPVLFGLLATGGSVIRSPELLLSLGPIGVVIIGAVLAGGAYCLNPLGSERDQLPLLLTSTPSVRRVLRGQMSAGAVLGLVVVVGVGFPLGVVGHGFAYAIGQSLLGAILIAASVGTCVGLGALVPKFEQREYMSVERAHPSQWAMLCVLFGGAVLGGIGFLLLQAALAGLTVGVLFGWTVYVFTLGFTGWLGYRYALRRFDEFTLDDM
jgi:hypothetical protein